MSKQREPLTAEQARGITADQFIRALIVKASSKFQAYLASDQNLGQDPQAARTVGFTFKDDRGIEFVLNVELLGFNNPTAS